MAYLCPAAQEQAAADSAAAAAWRRVCFWQSSFRVSMQGGALSRRSREDRDSDAYVGAFRRSTCKPDLESAQEELT